VGVPEVIVCACATSVNKMQVNPEKYQALSLGQNTHDKNIILNLVGISIVCDDEVKLLDVTIDFKLNLITVLHRNTCLNR
jgi:hypothetical protein